MRGELGKAIKDLIALSRGLAEEVGCIEAMVRSSDNHVWRRALVRCIFASIEGTTYGLKQLAFSRILLEEPDILDLGEAVMLQDQAFDIKENGTVDVRSAKTKTLNSIRFAFKVVPKVFGSSFVVDVDHSGWNQLTFSIKTRDRLMHPKGLRDIEVSDMELAHARNALFWFEEMTKDLYVSLDGKL
jgi:hypothetical protein